MRYFSKLFFCVIALFNTASPQVSASDLQTLFSLFVVQSVPVVGPEGEVVVYENTDGQIRIRQCALGTSKQEIENSLGCPLLSDTQVLVIPREVFKNLIESQLFFIDRSKLSEDQKHLLENSLAEVNLEAAQKKLEELNQLKIRLEEQRKDFPDDVGGRTQRVEYEIGTQTVQVNAFQNVVDAKTQMEQLLSGLLTDMEERPIRRTVFHSKDGDTVAFQLLKKISKISPCKSTYPEGTLCVTGKNGFFVRVKDGWTDLGTKLTWIDGVVKGNHYEASKICKEKDLELPTGWPESSNGRKGFPSHDSDIIAAWKNGVQEVHGDTLRIFWSNSIVPNGNHKLAFDFFGNGGGGGYADYQNRTNQASVICVRR